MRISVVCIPLRKFLFLETATREEEENCEGKNDDENDKQTYRDFVDIIRFARGPPDLPEAHADIFFPSSYARIQSRERIKAGYTPDSFTIENRSKSDNRFHRALFSFDSV